MPMRLSDQKINHLSHIIVKALATTTSINFLREENTVRLAILNAIIMELELDEQIEQQVRQRLDSYSRKFIEGTREWKIMYQKLYEQELVRLGRD